VAVMSLIGTYQHTIDAKGRMAFPTKLRERLGVSFYVTIGLDSCLYVYSNDGWDDVTAKITMLTGEERTTANFFLSNACQVEPDSQGRVLLPANLRKHAALNRDVTVVGVGNRAEIWDSERYGEFSQSITGEKLSKALSGLAL